MASSCANHFFFLREIKREKARKGESERDIRLYLGGSEKTRICDIFLFIVSARSDPSHPCGFIFILLFFFVEIQNGRSCKSLLAKKKKPSNKEKYGIIIGNLKNMNANTHLMSIHY